MYSYGLLIWLAEKISIATSQSLHARMVNILSWFRMAIDQMV